MANRNRYFGNNQNTTFTWTGTTRTALGCYVMALSDWQIIMPINSSHLPIGRSRALALFDELWGYVHTDAKRLWTEFKTDPTRLNSLKFVVGYSGYTGQFELWESLLTTRLKGEPVPELADITNNGDPACCANGRKFTFWSHMCLKWGDFLDLSFLASTVTHAKHCTLDIATK